MAKKRVYEIAKERGVSSKELLEALRAAGLDVKAAASTIDEGDALKALTPDGASGDGKPQATDTASPPTGEDKAATPPEAAAPAASSEKSPAPTKPQSAQRPAEAPAQRQPPREGAGAPPRRGISAREGAPGTTG